MEPRIELLSEKKLLGMSLSMSLTNNRTGELWRSFMQRRKEIKNHVGNNLFSMQVYDPTYFIKFDPSKEFHKWATIEVADFDHMPEGMQPFILPEGLYAVFHHKGSHTNTTTFQYIFTTWLPNCNYELDARPHFEVLGEKYKNGDPDSEEEIWIPIKSKG